MKARFHVTINTSLANPSQPLADQLPPGQCRARPYSGESFIDYFLSLQGLLLLNSTPQAISQQPKPWPGLQQAAFNGIYMERYRREKKRCIWGNSLKVAIDCLSRREMMIGI